MYLKIVIAYTHGIELQMPERAMVVKDVKDFKSKLHQHWNHEVTYMYQAGQADILVL